MHIAKHLNNYVLHLYDYHITVHATMYLEKGHHFIPEELSKNGMFYGD